MVDLAEAPPATASQGAPTAPMMRAPVQPTTAEPQPKQRKRRSGNGGGNGGRRGRAKLTAEQKEAARLEREQAAQARAEQQARGAEARRAVARLAAIGAVSPDLLSTDEVGAIAKFTLAFLRADGGQQ